jgi:ribose transport system permease protein
VCDALAAFLGCLHYGHYASASTLVMDGLQMEANAIFVLRGMAVSVGVFWTFIGALIVFTMECGSIMVGVNTWFQQAIDGAIIILAVALTIDRSRISIIK